MQDVSASAKTDLAIHVKSCKQKMKWIIIVCITTRYYQLFDSYSTPLQARPLLSTLHCAKQHCKERQTFHWQRMVCENVFISLCNRQSQQGFCTENMFSVAESQFSPNHNYFQHWLCLITFLFKTDIK